MGRQFKYGICLSAVAVTLVGCVAYEPVPTTTYYPIACPPGVQAAAPVGPDGQPVAQTPATCYVAAAPAYPAYPAYPYPAYAYPGYGYPGYGYPYPYAYPYVGGEVVFGRRGHWR